MGPEEFLGRYGFVLIVLIVLLFAAVQAVPRHLRLRAAKKHAETLCEEERRRFWRDFRL